ncbi:MAG: response regulator [Deltaproteobacteria bacterium]|nr:response regulator [Deltaproteobacteria bacterium]
MSTILVADSDESRLKHLRRLVRLEGHRTLAATTGPSALDGTLRTQPSMLVADTALPGLDGYGLALSVREELTPDQTRIILLKEAVAADDRTTARAVGADELVPRILGDQGLMDVIRMTLATRTATEGGVAGEIDDERLFPILQFLHQRRVTGTLSVTCKVPGTIVLAGGEIIGARTRDGQGTDAFAQLLGEIEGRYCFDTGLVDPASRSIEKAFDPLMMDVFALLDDA